MQEIVHPKGKVYYSMGEVADIFGVNPSLLRFWEQEFDVIKPRRNKKGNRLYRPEDVDNIRVIYHLVKERKMKLEVARKHIKESRGEVERDAAIMEKLLSIRSLLEEIKADMGNDGDFAEEEEIKVRAAQAHKKTVSRKPSVKKDKDCEPAQELVEAKPPFEEQPLFELVPQEEYVSVDQAMDAFIAKHYDEEADEEKPGIDPFATIPGVVKKEYIPEPEEKKRPVVIEQTLF